MNSALYDVFAAKAEMIEKSVSDDLPAHKFSLRYKRKKKALIKAYEQQREKGTDIQMTFRKIRVRQTIRFAVIAVLAAVLLTGAGLYVTHYIGGLQANQQSTHSDVSAINLEGAPETLENKYRVTYDFTGWEYGLMADDEYHYWEYYEKGDDFFDFSYYTKEMFQNSRMNTEGAQVETKYVNGFEALYFMRPNGTQLLSWDNGKYIFELVFTVDYNTALQIAESIRPMKYHITYDLSDYDMTVMSDYDFSYWEVYRKNDEYINYIYQTKEVFQNSRLNTEGTQIEKREVCGYEALYFEHSDGSKCLAWDNGDYIFEIQTNLDYDTALQIAESIKQE